jgi:hypothetical protein
MIQISSDPQVVFDTVCEHALKQNVRCKNEKNYCMYRNENGMKCFGGALIPDDQYDPNMEGLTWGELITKEYVSGENSDLIDQLQIIHDTEFPKKWVESLRELGKSCKLNLDKLPAVE